MGTFDPLTSLWMGVWFMETVGGLHAMHDPWNETGWTLICVADIIATFLCVSVHTPLGNAFSILAAWGAMSAYIWLRNLKRRGPPGGRA